MDDKPRDFPFEAMCKQAQELVEQGVDVFQKFSCRGCGERLMIEMPNKFFEEGTCPGCGTITNIKERGCNYLVRMMLTIDAENQDVKQANGHDHVPDGERGGNECN